MDGIVSDSVSRIKSSTHTTGTGILRRGPNTAKRTFLEIGTKRSKSKHQSNAKNDSTALFRLQFA